MPRTVPPLIGRVGPYIYIYSQGPGHLGTDPLNDGASPSEAAPLCGTGVPNGTPPRSAAAEPPRCWAPASSRSSRDEMPCRRAATSGSCEDSSPAGASSCAGCAGSAVPVDGRLLRAGMKPHRLRTRRACAERCPDRASREEARCFVWADGEGHHDKAQTLSKFRTPALPQ